MDEMDKVNEILYYLKNEDRERKRQSKFVEIEFVVNRKAKRINKVLIRRDSILKVSFAHTKNPVLYYLTFQDVNNWDSNKVDFIYLTQESYEKLKNQLD